MCVRTSHPSSSHILGRPPPKQSAPEVFFRKFKFWDGGEQDAPPVFLVEGTTYLHTRDGGLHVVATTRENVSPSLVLELLKRIGSIIRVTDCFGQWMIDQRYSQPTIPPFIPHIHHHQDYCGILSEEAVRKNFVLVYELLDEVVDYGFPQSSSSDALKEFVLNEPVLIRPTVFDGGVLM